MVIQDISSINGVDFRRARINGVEIVKRVGDEGIIVVLDWKPTPHPFNSAICSFVSLFLAAKEKNKDKEKVIEEKP